MSTTSTSLQGDREQRTLVALLHEDGRGDGVGQGALGALDFDCVSDLQARDVLGDVTGGV